MTYVALLRGINVGGNNRVEMSRLKNIFGVLGFSNIRTYINSGNVLFDTTPQDDQKLAQEIETAITDEFDLVVPVVVRDEENLRTLEKSIPSSWVHDKTMKTDVMFLWKSYDSQDVLNGLKFRPGIEDVIYLPGAVVWRIDMQNATKSGLMKIVGTDLYKHMTIRNINTLRKLVALLG